MGSHSHSFIHSHRSVQISIMFYCLPSKLLTYLLTYTLHSAYTQSMKSQVAYFTRRQNKYLSTRFHLITRNQKQESAIKTSAHDRKHIRLQYPAQYSTVHTHTHAQYRVRNKIDLLIKKGSLRNSLRLIE